MSAQQRSSTPEAPAREVPAGEAPARGASVEGGSTTDADAAGEVGWSGAASRAGDRGRPSGAAVTRLGAVSYLNTRPLVYGLDSDPRFLVRFDVPSQCADLLEAGAIDLGLIPSFEYARYTQASAEAGANPGVRVPAGDGVDTEAGGARDAGDARAVRSSRGADHAHGADDPHDAGYFIVPRVAIASTHAVDSVAMFTRRPIRDIRRIALDTSSRTSANLLRLLCAAWFRITPEFVNAPPDLDRMLQDADAALLIGDPALFTDAEALGLQKVDLGLTWREMTGLPFVWAFWAGRREAASPDVCRALADTRDRGIPAIDRIATAFAPADTSRALKVARYLRESIAYDLDGAFETGLRTYYALLGEHGLLPPGAEPRFYPA